jgi:zinc/manganese transport system permease protein
VNIALDFSLIAPPLAAGLLVLATHVPLGREVLKRGIVFIDIALAQFAALGVVLAHFLHWETPWLTQTAAFVMAVLGALALNLTESKWPAAQEAIIGSAYVVVASLAIVLLANDPQGGEHLRELLVGQILWTGWTDLWPLAAVTAFVLAAWFGLNLRRSRLAFYVLFAFSVTMSVQLVGVFLVFASLIIPALAARMLPDARALGVAWLAGAAGYALGLIASALFDLPAGAIIVCAIALASMLAALLSSARSAL